MAIGLSTGQHYEDEFDMLHEQVFGSGDQSDLSQPKKIYFVRHGDTDMNKEGSAPTDGNYKDNEPVRGWSDVSLNAEGRKHAQKAAEGVKGLPIEHIVSSDLPRAAETARVIGNRLDVPVEYNPGLRTWDLGAYTGQSGKDVHKAVDRLCMEAQDERPPSGKFTGESFNEFKDRILGTMSDIVQRHNDKEILVVSHNSPERVLHSWTEAGQPQKQMEQAESKEGFISRLLGNIFGKSTPAPRTDVDLSNDPRLVHPGMGFNIPFESAKVIENANISGADRAALYARYYSPNKLSMGSEHVEQFNKSIEAMSRSPVTKLGFDPTRTYFSRDAGKTTVGGSELDKTVWSNAYYNTNLIHESMHRGLEILENEGLIPKGGQEAIVRRLMYKYFGNIEGTHGSDSKRQMEEALTSVPLSQVEAIEKIAREHFNKLHPGLPKDAQ